MQIFAFYATKVHSKKKSKGTPLQKKKNFLPPFMIKNALESLSFLVKAIYGLFKSEKKGLTTHVNPLPLETSLHSNWDDFHNIRLLLFTKDNEDEEEEEPEKAKSKYLIKHNTKAQMERIIRATQEHICYEVEELEAEAFQQTGLFFFSLYLSFVLFFFWKKKKRVTSYLDKSGRVTPYSGGLIKVLSNGKIFEKAGVNISVQSGSVPASSLDRMASGHAKLKKLLVLQKKIYIYMYTYMLGDEKGNVEYFVSTVKSELHPWNPHAPSGHFCCNYFEFGDIDKSTGEFVCKVWWFNGESELSPAIIYEDDCAYFHRTLKQACELTHPSYYPRFKDWCDKHFFIPHRNETRGIGGIYFDDLTCNDDNVDEKERLVQFVKNCASAHVAAYIPLVRRHALQQYSAEEKEWQQLRRGRYVEFQLMHDRGNVLDTSKPRPNMESIFLSLPLTARWEYCRSPAHPFETIAEQVYSRPRDWLAPSSK
ncbi:hypothetical protein RFI_29078 [Reticulomyxa filosa]|uniref:coproporphyrinogen oxidase n=1 Tax=Reticulomyxa filosa TaxID=46433 RepID=X6M3W9_RETFI|nr:hypothetical protein RFI_29078 [Reticulomyxa filosa]|eukprot:ETO08311.1 hypothetical protein RFI_29078 [Reticulomyxa filosa]